MPFSFVGERERARACDEVGFLESFVIVMLEGMANLQILQHFAILRRKIYIQSNYPIFFFFLNEKVFVTRK